MITANNQYERSLVGDKEAQQFKKDAEEQNTFENIYDGFKNPFIQMYYGIRKSTSFLPVLMKKYYESKIGVDNNSKSSEQIKKEIDEYMYKYNRQYNAKRIASPVSTTLGEFAPYVLTGIAGEAAMLKIGAKLAPKIKALKINVHKKLGNLDEVSRIQKRQPPKQEAFNRNLNVALRGIVTGAAEGAAQHDSTALKGALTSAIGGAAGIVTPFKLLDKVPVEGGPAHKALVKELHREGFQITPGVRTGNKTVQTEEAGIRNSDNLAQLAYNKVDEPNLKRLSNMIGEAIGLDMKGQAMVTRAEMRNHVKSLKKEYTKLEKSTRGRFEDDAMERLQTILDVTKPTKFRNVSNKARERHNILKDIFGDMRRDVQFTSRGPDGKFTKATYDGSKYQSMERRIKDEMKSANISGDRALLKHLTDIKEELKISMESGLGEAKVKDWSDLHERTAMTNLVLENGIRASGKINPSGITKKVMSKNEVKRTLTGQGGRITKLQDVGKYSDFLKDVKGGALTGLGSSNRSVDRGLVKRGFNYVTHPAQALALNYRLNTLGIPLIGKRLSPAHGIDPSATVKAFRAYETAAPYDIWINELMGNNEDRKKEERKKDTK